MWWKWLIVTSALDLSSLLVIYIVALIVTASSQSALASELFILSLPRSFFVFTIKDLSWCYDSNIPIYSSIFSIIFSLFRIKLIQLNVFAYLSCGMTIMYSLLETYLFVKLKYDNIEATDEERRPILHNTDNIPNVIYRATSQVSPVVTPDNIHHAIVISEAIWGWKFDGLGSGTKSLEDLKRVSLFGHVLEIEGLIVDYFLSRSPLTYSRIQACLNSSENLLLNTIKDFKTKDIISNIFEFDIQQDEEFKIFCLWELECYLSLILFVRGVFQILEQRRLINGTYNISKALKTVERIRDASLKFDYYLNYNNICERVNEKLDYITALFHLFSASWNYKLSKILTSLGMPFDKTQGIKLLAKIMHAQTLNSPSAACFLMYYHTQSSFIHAIDTEIEFSLITMENDNLKITSKRCLSSKSMKKNNDVFQECLRCWLDRLSIPTSVFYFMLCLNYQRLGYMEAARSNLSSAIHSHTPTIFPYSLVFCHAKLCFLVCDWKSSLKLFESLWINVNKHEYLAEFKISAALWFFGCAELVNFVEPTFKEVVDGNSISSAKEFILKSDSNNGLLSVFVNIIKSSPNYRTHTLIYALHYLDHAISPLISNVNPLLQHYAILQKKQDGKDDPLLLLLRGYMKKLVHISSDLYPAKHITNLMVEKHFGDVEFEEIIRSHVDDMYKWVIPFAYYELSELEVLKGGKDTMKYLMHATTKNQRKISATPAILNRNDLIVSIASSSGDSERCSSFEHIEESGGINGGLVFILKNWIDELRENINE